MTSSRCSRSAAAAVSVPLGPAISSPPAPLRGLSVRGFPAQALTLNGQQLHGQPIIVQSSLAEKNRLAAAGATSAEIKAVGGVGLNVQSDGAKLYVGGLHYDITEDQLREIFTPFGELTKVVLHHEPGGQSKGCAGSSCRLDLGLISARSRLDLGSSGSLSAKLTATRPRHRMPLTPHIARAGSVSCISRWRRRGTSVWSR